MRWQRWWVLVAFSLSSSMMGQFVLNSEQVAVSINTSFSGSWPYTFTDSSRTSSLDNTLLGAELSLALQWYALSPEQKEDLLDQGRNVSGFILDKIFHKIDFSVESEHSLLLNFGGKSDSPGLSQKSQPRSYYGRVSLALHFEHFLRFQINTLGIGAVALSLDENNLTYLYFAPLQRIRIDLPLNKNFIRAEYEGSLLAFAYNFERRSSADLETSNSLIGNFRLGWFMPSFYSSSENSQPYFWEPTSACKSREILPTTGKAEE